MSPSFVKIASQLRRSTFIVHNIIQLIQNTMREIKFRIWDGKGMIIPSETFGDLRDEYAVSLFGERYYIKEESNGNYCPPSLAAKQMQLLTLMQFTGLKDKNGVEIYEGDIVKDEDENTVYEIIWDLNFCRFALGEVDEDGEPMCGGVYPIEESLFADEYTLLGNVYEHPQMLKSEQGSTSE